MSRTVALVACLVAGLIMTAQYFSPHPVARTVNTTMLEWWQIIFGFSLIVGIAGVVRGQLRTLRQGSSMLYPGIILGAIAIMPIAALMQGIGPDSIYMWLFEHLQAPLQSTVFALLAFYVASASLRGFHARSATAGLLLISAAFVLLSRSGIGDAIPIISTCSDWLRDNPSMAARRAILIGIGLGSVATSLRLILGIERTWLGKSA